jgi:hypothetical protein
MPVIRQFHKLGSEAFIQRKVKIGKAISREIEKLAPSAPRITGGAGSAFFVHSAQHRKATAGQTTFAAAVADFDSRPEATRAAITEKRRWISIENASLRLLILEPGLGHA